VREALRALKTMGVIETRPGAGSFLQQFDPAALIRPEVLSLVLMGEGLHDILEARQVLECHVARVAARCGPDELAPLGAALVLPGSHKASSEEVFQLTWAFHMCLAQIAGNPVMSKLVRILYEMISGIELKLYWPNIDPLRELQRHRDLYSAILAGEEQAASAMRDHISYIALVVEKAIGGSAGLGSISLG
jgi:GntR family transcriptional repressor for pyruvate dehydrogenase complex